MQWRNGLIPLEAVALPGERSAWLTAFGVLALLWLGAPVSLGSFWVGLLAVVVSIGVQAAVLALHDAWLRGNAVVISERSHPWLVSAAAECGAALGLEMGRDFVLRMVLDPQPNAFVTGFGHPQMLVVHSGALDVLERDPDRLRFLFGHELLHIRRHDPLKSLLTGTLGGAALRWLRWIGLPASIAFGLTRQWAECAADRGGVLLGGARAACESLVRLSGYACQTDRIDYAAIVAAARAHSRSLCGLVDLVSTHPSVGARLHRILEWVFSEEFACLVGQARAQDERVALAAMGLSLPAQGLSARYTRNREGGSRHVDAADHAT